MSSTESAPRPIVVDSKVFDTYSEVSDFLVRRLSEPHHVSRLFVPEVVGVLIYESGQQKLRLVGAGMVGLVDRHMHGLVEDGVTVSGFPGQSVDVVTHIEPWKSNLLDRGLSWVGVGPESPARLKLTINQEHGVEDPAEVAARLESAEQRTVEFIEAILRSEVIEPLARGDVA